MTVHSLMGDVSDGRLNFIHIGEACILWQNQLLFLQYQKTKKTLRSFRWFG